MARADIDAFRQLLATARAAVGQRQISFRVDTVSLETVYIEDRDADLVVHDRGETWSYIATHPDSELPWDEQAVAGICDQRQIRRMPELDDGRVCAMRLERRVATADQIADVVRAVDEAIDLIFKAPTNATMHLTGTCRRAPVAGRNGWVAGGGTRARSRRLGDTGRRRTSRSVLWAHVLGRSRRMPGGRWAVALGSVIVSAVSACSGSGRAAISVTAVGVDPPVDGVLVVARIEQSGGTAVNWLSSGPAPLGSKRLLMGGAGLGERAESRSRCSRFFRGFERMTLL